MKRQAGDKKMFRLIFMVSGLLGMILMVPMFRWVGIDEPNLYLDGVVGCGLFILTALIANECWS